MSDLTCPFHGHVGAVTPAAGPGNRQWWPEVVDLGILHQHNPAANPLGPTFDYARSFAELDYEALKADLRALMTDSQPWWPADWGHYGGLFIRMAWHSAGTYRSADGRGGGAHGNQRFAPLNSWPDNTNLDKARRLLWPLKRRYGNRIFWEPEADVFWGKESRWLGDERHSGEGALEQPLAAVEMGLIYVNPEGPHGNPDPVASGRDVRDTFARMGMTVEETVALVAGGHTFGKCHGAAPADNLGPEPEGAPLEEMGLGWHNRLGSGMAEHTITSGIEGAWKPNPTRWDQGYFEMMFTYEWELTKSPAGAWQWVAKDVAPEHMIPDAHVPGRSAAPIMTTADLSLRFDPILAPIAKRFRDDHRAFADTFARAWYKLTHRDLGPRALHLGPEVPAEELIWQDPLPRVDHPLIEAAEVAELRERVWNAGLGVSELVATAWASASSFRGSDRRGGANGARIRLAPQRSWEVNDPPQLARVLQSLTEIQAAFAEGRGDGKRVSLADLIVLAGGFAVEKAAAAAGVAAAVPFHPGRTDARDDQTDSASFNVLKPQADGFRNWESADLPVRAEELLIDRAQQLGLSAPELTVLVGGLRVLGANSGGSRHGVFTDRPGVLSPDFFTHLLDMELQWAPAPGSFTTYEGRQRSDGSLRWTATRADLIFGSHSQLRAIAEIYAQDDGAERFIHDFAGAWVKVMELDRFDLAG